MTGNAEKKASGKKQVRNRTGEMLSDYVKTNQAYSEENRRRQEDEGVKNRGMKNLNTLERSCLIIIILGLIGIAIKYFI